MRLRGNDAKFTAMEKVHNRHVQKLFAVSIAIPLDNIRYTASRYYVGELVGILHRQQFSLEVFSLLVKSSCGCEVISEELLNEIKYVFSFV